MIKQMKQNHLTLLQFPHQFLFRLMSNMKVAIQIAYMRIYTKIKNRFIIYYIVYTHGLDMCIYVYSNKICLSNKLYLTILPDISYILNFSTLSVAHF